MERDALAAMPEAASSTHLLADGVSGDPSIPPGRVRTSDRHAHGSPLRALRSRPYRWYFAGQLASVSGTFLQATALGWLVLQLTGSPAALGLVLAAGTAPLLLAGPWGGVLADRWDLRRLLIATQATQAALAGALWAFVVSGTADLPILIALGVASGVVSVVDSPARQSFVSRLVEPADLPSAVSLNGVVMNGARVVGPAVAGVMIATVGTTPCFAVNAVSYLAVLVALAIIRPLSGGGGSTGRGGVRATLRYAATKPQLWLPLVMTSVVGLVSFNFGVILPVFADRDLGGGGETYGLLQAVLSIGSVIGSLAAGAAGHPRRILLVVSAVGFAVGLGGTAAAPDVLLACVALLLTGAAAFSFVTFASTALQLHAAPAYRGRVMALFTTAYLGTTPLGSLLSGWLIETAGARAALLAGSAGALLVACVAAAVRTPPVGEPAAASGSAQPPV